MGEARAARTTAATPERTAGGGRRRPSASSQPWRRLAFEALAIAALIAIGAAVAYRLGVHHLHNPRPLGGRNVDVSRSPGVQSQTAIAAAPGDPRLLVEAANDDTVAVSGDGGRSWSRTSGPVGAIGACPHRTPRVAIDAAGREYLAWLAGRLCDDDLTSYLDVAERDGPHGRWHVARVTRPAWSYGYDDGPALAVDPRNGDVYVAFERSLGERLATTVVSSSRDHGRTWSPPALVSRSLVRPHLASLAAADGTLYAAGIDARLGVWIAASRNGGRSFTRPHSVARLVQNPAGGCALAVDSPLPREATRCAGPDPTVVARGPTLAVVYADGGRNGAGDVFAATLDPATLRVRARRLVHPADGGNASRQFLPAAAVDRDTGVLWACWYDTRYGRGGHAWFTCAASRGGRRWSAPERAASVPSETDALGGDAVRYGLSAGLAAAGGVAHPVWIDTRHPHLLEEAYTAALPERAALRR